MEKNKWIDEVLKSSEEIQRAAAGPFFHEKVMQRMESLKKEPVRMRPAALWALRASLAMIIAMNIICITAYFRQSYSTAQSTETKSSGQKNIYTELSTELELQSNYNY